MTFLYKLLLFCFAVVGAFCFPFVLSGLFFLAKSLHTGKKIPHRKYPSTWSQHSLVRRLLVDFPAAFVHDLLTYDNGAC